MVHGPDNPCLLISRSKPLNDANPLPGTRKPSPMSGGGFQESSTPAVPLPTCARETKVGAVGLPIAAIDKMFDHGELVFDTGLILRKRA